jgi:hypothetical protein
MSCTIPLSSLTAGPFSLGLGEMINAKVVAYNVNGDSLQSAVGGTDKIVLIPDPPANLGYDYFQTISDAIGIQWTDGPSIGGSPILEYIVWYDNAAANGVYTILG